MLSWYGKVNEVDQARLESGRRTRKRLAIIVISSVVLACIVVGAVVGATTGGGKNKNEKEQSGPDVNSFVRMACNVTLYKDTCYKTIGPAAGNKKVQPEDIFRLSVQLALIELSRVAKNISSLHGNAGALGACGELLDLAIYHLNETINASPQGSITLIQMGEDLRTRLSSVTTYQQTCIDAINDAEDNGGDGKLKTLIEELLKGSSEMTSNSLAIITWLSKIASSIKLRRLMSSSPEYTWLSERDRRLMESPELKKKAHIVVAKDGTGKYRTIKRALEDVPEKSTKRTIIYVKKGVYVENVKIDKKKWNIVMVGDGMQSTIVSGRLNVIDGTPTFQTATFAVFGKGFIGRDMGFRNTAGAQKHQAVALMASADQTAFYRCRVDAFQDSLYAHAQRQFYREVTVLGTVDFIFGNSAAVLQNCHIRPRRPMQGQQITITAQGRTDPNQNTGLSIQNATISPFGNLSGVKTYLGRPWKNFSTTVYMQSFMDKFVEPKGWLPWTGDSAPDTIFYAEFKNFGPGASTKNRVKWKGLRFINENQAKKFTVEKFIEGKKWIPETGLKFKSGL